MPIAGIEVRFRKDAPKRFRLEPGGVRVEARKDDGDTVAALSPVEIHAMLIGEY